MDSDYANILKGIWLVLGAQLFLLSAAKLVFGTRKQLPLAFICMVVAMWFLRKFFRGTWEEYYLLNIIMGGRKEVLLGPLVLIHLRMLTQPASSRWVLKHLAIPIIVYMTYLVISTGFWEYYESIYDEFLMGYVVIVILSFWYYLYLGIQQFRTELKPKLIPQAYSRHLVFFGAFFAYYIFLPVFDFIGVMTSFENIRLFDFVLFDVHIGGVYHYILRPYFLLLSFFLFIYALAETRYFKNLFLARDIIVKEQPQEQLEYVNQLVREHFYEAKLFLNPDLTLTNAAKTIGCSRKDLNNYLKHQELSFTEFVNQLKVTEFKTLIVKDENQVYDMVSVAEKAGFRSKATFNRVFKQLEGVTPRDYRKSVLEV